MAFLSLAPSARRPALMVESLEAREVPATLTVDDSFVAPAPGSGKFTTIQAAVNAANPNDKIEVKNGIYSEQVTFNPTKDGVKLLAKGGNVTITTPADLVSPLAIVNVAGADDVTIDGFRIVGPLAASDLGNGILVGDGGSATIRNNTISDIRANPVSGEQDGDAIQIGGFLPNGTETPGTALIENNRIVRYQKTGVVVFNEGSSAVVRDNVITGLGATTVIAQNGVEVSFGADATVTGNTISGNDFTPAGTESAGVYINQAGVVVVSRNKLDRNEVGVLAESQTAGLLISGNKITRSSQDGITLTASRFVAVVNNDISDSGRDGVRLAGTSFSLVTLNRVTKSAGVDIRSTNGSAFNLVFLNSTDD